MEKSLIIFLYVLAWPTALYCTFVAAVSFIGAITYSDLQKVIDNMRGVRMRFFYMRYAIIALVAWAIIIALWHR
jgi:hypothetical protein